jgi:hypothetical protein
MPLTPRARKGTIMSRKPQGHSVAPGGKRVQVVLFTGASFVAKFKRKEGAYHEFYDHDKLRSDKIYQLRILPTDANPMSYRQEQKIKEITEKLQKEFGPHAKITVRREKPGGQA